MEDLPFTRSGRRRQPDKWCNMDVLLNPHLVPQVAGKNKFLNELIRIISPKFGLHVPQQVRIGLLAAMVAWSVCAEGWGANINPAIHTLAEAGVTVPAGYHMAEVHVPPGESYKDIADPLEGALLRITQSIATDAGRTASTQGSDLLSFDDSFLGAASSTSPAAVAGLDDLLGLRAEESSSFNPRAAPSSQIYEGELESAIFPAGPVQLAPPTFHEGYLLIGKSETEQLLMRNKVRVVTLVPSNLLSLFTHSPFSGRIVLGS